MIRGWLGLALLTASWLLGLHYYQPASWLAWAVAVLLGTILLAGAPAGLPAGLPGRRRSGLALVLLLPAVWFMPWPYRAAPLLMVLGLALHVLSLSRPWSERLRGGAVCAGVILLVQSLGLLAYTHQTARSHDLPWPWPHLLGAIARLLGADVAVDGNSLVIRSLGEVYRLGATWELLLDPVTLCFLAGGLAMAGVQTQSMPSGNRWAAWLRTARGLALAVAAWLPLRAGLLIALFLHRAVRADLAVPLAVMNQFLSPWVHLALLSGPVLLAWWFVRLPSDASTKAAQERPPAVDAGRGWQSPAALALAFAAVAVFTLTLLWDPIGQRKDGRVMVVERHSTWEPTLRPYDTTWFGEPSSYNYAAIYDYASRFYEMSRLLESDRIDDGTLGTCDVLVVKIPTSPFSPEEVEAIGRFVEQGGGLLLIGDHTNVFKSSSYLNQVTRQFGFVYRHDLLFSVGSPFYEAYRPGLVPHPAVQHVPPMEFAVSCSIDPGRSSGQAVVQSPGLWNLPPDYNADNFHPQAQYCSEMRYGAFIQVWATRYGAGRVLAFTDSTIFSNFCVFEPGKSELMMGMLEWLNHRSALDQGWLRRLVTIVLVVVAVALGAGALVLARPCGQSWLVLLAAGVLGWTAASMTAATAQRRAMPPPEAVRPMFRVVLDRTASEVPLSRDGFTAKDGRGYGLFEQWIPRLGYFTTRRSGPEAFCGNLLVVVCPTRSVSAEFREGLVQYVAEGGRLLVIDSPDVEGSTANSLLWPFGLAAIHSTNAKGELKLSDDWPVIPLEAVCEIQGGTPVLWVNATPVAAQTRYGQGSVMAIGFGSLFNDATMGSTWMTEPDAEMLTRFDLLFSVVRAAAQDEPVVQPQSRQIEAAKPKPKKPSVRRRPGE